MNILLLGPPRQEMIDFLSQFGDKLINVEHSLDRNKEILDKVDFIVSYGYRHILSKDILDRFHNRAVNLHISLLPWNRGADPNLWSFLENTPKGVTIHFLDPGLDTGEIIAQQEVEMSSEDTLRTSYEKLSAAIFQLFKEHWIQIRSKKAGSTPQPKGGSYHTTRDSEPYKEILYLGWDTPVKHIITQVKK